MIVKSLKLMKWIIGVFADR